MDRMAEEKGKQAKITKDMKISEVVGKYPETAVVMLKQGMHCVGCLPRNCFIKRGCKKLRKNEIKFCFQCKEMPCENLNRLDRRYRTHYNMSMVENLKELKKKGMKKFLVSQKKKYKCPECGGVICVHDKKCYDCGYKQEK